MTGLIHMTFSDRSFCKPH